MSCMTSYTSFKHHVYHCDSVKEYDLSHTVAIQVDYSACVQHGTVQCTSVQSSQFRVHTTELVDYPIIAGHLNVDTPLIHC